MIYEYNMYADPMGSVAAKRKKLAVPLSDGDRPIGEIRSGGGAQLQPVKPTAGVIFLSILKKLMADVAPEKRHTLKKVCLQRNSFQRRAQHLVFQTSALT